MPILSRLDKNLEGFTLGEATNENVNENQIMDPHGNVVGRFNSRSNTICVDRDQTGHELLLKAAGMSKFNVVTETDKPKPKVKRPAQGLDRAHNYAASLQNGRDVEVLRKNLFLKIERDYSQEMVMFTTNHRDIARKLIQKLTYVRQAIFGGKMNKELTVQVPQEYTKGLLEVLDVDD